MAEAMRLAFADRAVWMGDADFVARADQGPDRPALRRACAAQLIDPGRAHGRTRCRRRPA